MHGIQCSGRRLIPQVPEPILPHDSLIFGADVTRGSGNYPPLPISRLSKTDHSQAQFRALKVSFDASWSDGKDGHQDSHPLQWSSSSRDADAIPVLPSFPNTFTADYSEEDLYDDDADQENFPVKSVAEMIHSYSTKNTVVAPSYADGWADYEQSENVDDPDDDVQFVKESIRAASVEIVIPQRGGSVVASEYSDHASSYFSEGEEGESPTSSPIGLNDDHADNLTYQESTKAVHTQSPSLAEQLEDAAHPRVSIVVHPQSSQYVQVESDDLYGCSDDEDAAVPQSENPILETVSTLSPFLEPNCGAKLPPMNKVFAELGPYDSARAPSPSEVAMVKPTTDIIQQPCIEPTLAPWQSPKELGRYVNGPVVQHPSSPQYSPTSPCNSYWDPQEETTAAQYELLTSYDPHYKVPLADSPKTPHVGQFSSKSRLAATPFKASTSAPGQKEQSVPKFSIPQLPKLFKDVREESKVLKSLKRKADEMSNTIDQQQPSEKLTFSIPKNDLESRPEMKNSGDMYPSNEHEVNQTSISVVDPLAQPISEETELPPRKKAKKTQSTDGGSMMKLAAAAITGVAIGTVGTIIGLASLPQDYFL